MPLVLWTSSEKERDCSAPCSLSRPAFILKPPLKGPYTPPLHLMVPHVQSEQGLVLSHTSQDKKLPALQCLACPRKGWPPAPCQSISEHRWGCAPWTHRAAVTHSPAWPHLHQCCPRLLSKAWNKVRYIFESFSSSDTRYY